MFTTYNNRQLERQLDRDEEDVGPDRCIQLKTKDRQRDSQIERQLDREEEEVGTGLCLQHTTIDSQRDSKIEMRRRQVQIDVYNLKQQIDRGIVRLRGGGGRDRFMFTTYINSQIERYFDREEEEVGTDRCLQHVTID